MIVLVTGYKGFIGSNLVNKLNEKHDVVGVDIKDGNNVLDADYINMLFDQHPFDAVIHLAAIPGVAYSIDHSEEVLNNNIVGFDVVAKAAINHNVKHFIYASSSSVYGDDGTQRSPYAVSKAANELQAAMYSNLSDTKFTGLRFFTVYGKGIRKDLAIYRFVESIRNNKPIQVYGDGTQSRDFTYVDDITEAIRLMLESDKDWKNEVFDVGYGESVTVNRLIGLIADGLGKEPIVEYVGDRKCDVKSTLSSTDKLYNWFNYKPKYNIKKGLYLLLNNI